MPSAKDSGKHSKSDFVEKLQKLDNQKLMRKYKKVDSSNTYSSFAYYQSDNIQNSDNPCGRGLVSAYFR